MTETSVRGERRLVRSYENAGQREELVEVGRTHETNSHGSVAVVHQAHQVLLRVLVEEL